MVQGDQVRFRSMETSKDGGRFDRHFLEELSKTTSYAKNAGAKTKMNKQIFFFLDIHVGRNE